MGEEVALTYRRENSLPPSSCEGDPAPSLALPAVARPLAPRPLVPAKEDLSGLPVEDSMGELLAVEEFERG